MPAEIVAAHGFLVLSPATVQLPAAGTVELHQPDGQLADLATYAALRPDRSLSRYPVHGGAWQADTPLTPNDWNQPAAATPTASPSPTATPAPITTASQAPPAAPAPAGPGWPWMLPVLVLGALGWRGRTLLLTRRPAALAPPPSLDGQSPV